MGQAQSQSSGGDCGDCSESGNGDSHYTFGKSLFILKIYRQ